MWGVIVMKEIKIIREQDAKPFLEGDEYCKLYVITDKMQFGTSHLLPGYNGAIDKGHQTGDEIFFVVKGKILVYLRNKDTYIELNTHDSVVIPPHEPHQLFNVFDEEALLCWFLAPPDNVDAGAS